MAIAHNQQVVDHNGKTGNRQRKKGGPNLVAVVLQLPLQLHVLTRMLVHTAAVNMRPFTERSFPTVSACQGIL